MTSDFQCQFSRKARQNAQYSRPNNLATDLEIYKDTFTFSL